MTKTRIATFHIDGITRDEDGFLRCDARLSKTGVFNYSTPSGETVRELRADAEVFAPESLESYLGAPVTVRHPSSFVNAKNYKLLAVGHVLKTGVDDPYVAGQLLIHDAKTIAKIESGDLTEISMGYRCDIEVGDGSEFDARQTNIRINHAALLGSGEGRLGSDVGIMRLDSNNDIVIEKDLLMERTDTEAVETQETAPTEDAAAAAPEATSETTPAEATDAPQEEQLPETDAAEETKEEQPEEDKMDSKFAALDAKLDAILSLLSPKAEDAKEPETKTDSLDVEQLVEKRLAQTLKARAAFIKVFPKEKLDGLNDREMALRVIARVDSEATKTEESTEALIEKADLVAKAIPEETKPASRLRERLLGSNPAVSTDESFAGRMARKLEGKL
jgi:hypothetical protein